MPQYFTPSSETELSLSRGNLTYVTKWTMQFVSSSSYRPFRDQTLFLAYHGSEDVWPWHTNDVQITNVIAPYGEQQYEMLPTSYKESDGFRAYMACGNTGDEGESGETYDVLQIESAKNGF
jgi:hypothetical protein